MSMPLSTCGWQLLSNQVGTGFHGTLSGNVYCSSAKILDDIRAFKGMPPAVEAEGDDQEEAGQGDTGRSTSQARREKAEERQRRVAEKGRRRGKKKAVCFCNRRVACFSPGLSVVVDIVSKSAESLADACVGRMPFCVFGAFVGVIADFGVSVFLPLLSELTLRCNAPNLTFL